MLCRSNAIVNGNVLVCQLEAGHFQRDFTVHEDGPNFWEVISDTEFIRKPDDE